MSSKKSLGRTITTTNLQLEKPLITDYYDVNVFNGNMDKIDKVCSEINASIFDLSEVCSEMNISISNLSSEVNGQRLRGINIANTLIEKIEG